jgi:hypothetical protein
MYQQITILTLHKQGIKQIDIAKQQGCHRNTVRNIIRREKPIEKLSWQKPSQFDQYHQQIKDLLDQNITNRVFMNSCPAPMALDKPIRAYANTLKSGFPNRLRHSGCSSPIRGMRQSWTLGI